MHHDTFFALNGIALLQCSSGYRNRIWGVIASGTIPIQKDIKAFMLLTWWTIHHYIIH